MGLANVCIMKSHEGRSIVAETLGESCQYGGPDFDYTYDENNIQNPDSDDPLDELVWVSRKRGWMASDTGTTQTNSETL